MKRVLLAVIILLVSAISLAAAEADVTWVWFENDPNVQFYRYQIDGEDDDNWTVVDFLVNEVTVTLDVSVLHTLYLQQSYDGIHWSASSFTESEVYPEYEEEEENFFDDDFFVDEPEPEVIIETPEEEDDVVYEATVIEDEVYLPAGTVWIDYWTGETTEGGRTVKVSFPEDRGGSLYIRGGAIIPTEQPKQYVDCKDGKEITLEIYPCGSSNRTFYEDDGVTCDYEKGMRTATAVSCEEKKGGCVITVGKREGGFAGMRSDREYTLRVFTEKTPKTVTVNGKAAEFLRDGNYTVFALGKEGKAELAF